MCEGDQMAQIKVYALRMTLGAHRSALSAAIHQSVVEALQYPPDKRFHRFIALEEEDFIFPADRSENYTIIEISMFAGRSVAVKKQLIRSIFANIERSTGITPQDVEITIVETPRENWGIRGMPGDELALNYNVNLE
jgi:phenylpyruvate tautomerase PptA (4-oxalocrotonate tautomerase family)